MSIVSLMLTLNSKLTSPYGRREDGHFKKGNHLLDVSISPYTKSTLSAKRCSAARQFKNQYPLSTAG